MELLAIGTGEFSYGQGAMSVDTTIKRSGSYALRYTGIGYATTTTGFNTPGAALRSYLYLSATPSAASSITGFSSTTGILAYLRLRTDRKLELYLNGYPASATLLATSTFAIPTGSFEHYVELWVDRTTKIVAARYNGTEWARAVVSAFADPGNIDNAWFGPDQATLTGCTIYYDDLGINSLDGQHNAGWCGPSAGGVLTFWPNDNAELTPSTWTVIGSVTSVADAINEVSPDDATTYIVEGSGTNGAAAGFYFPDWPLRLPASCVLFGVRGGASDVTSRLANLQFHDAMGEGVISTNVNWNLNGWKTVYPMLTVEEAMDGTRRMLSNGYLYTSLGKGLRSRAIIVRADAFVREIRITTVWMTVDFPLALTANVIPSARSAPQILTTLDP